MEIEQGDALTLLLIIIPAGLAAVVWAYVYMKRRQARIVSEAIKETNNALTKLTTAHELLAEEAGETISTVIDLLVSILVFLACPKNTQEESNALASIDLAMEGLTAETLNELRDRLTVDAKAIIEKMMGQSWDKLIEDARTKPSSKGHDTVGGNGDYFS